MISYNLLTTKISVPTWTYSFPSFSLYPYINNLRYADYTTLMAESEEELKSFLMKVKEESENFGL